ncbi:MAG: hypothetical protein ACRDO1_21300 [Nocardioidaceae bacterium]
MDIFTWTQWLAAGHTRQALIQGLTAGEIRRVLRGVYASSGVPDVLENRARAVRLVRPSETVVARETAAWLSGVDVLPPGRRIEDEPLHLVMPRSVTPPRLAGCTAYQGQLPAEDVVEQDGILRTTDLRTALDLSRFRDREQAVAALDAYLHLERVTLEQLWARARLLQRVRNCRRLRANLAVADGGAESYAESAQRVLFVDAGLPRPKTQVPVNGLAGDLIGALDMGWVAYLVGSEFDGEVGHDDDEQRDHDGARRSRMRREANWAIEVARKGDLWGSPAQLVHTVAHRLVERGWSPPPAVLEQIVRAADYEANTGERWRWMPLERLLAA